MNTARILDTLETIGVSVTVIEVHRERLKADSGAFAR